MDPESLLTGISYTYPTGYSGTRIGPVSFGYDHWGRRASMGSDAAAKTYTYDDLDELVGTTTGFGTDYNSYPGPTGLTLAYARYPDGSRGYWQANGGAYQTYQYDGVGRLTATYLGGDRVYGSSYTYLPNGWLAHQQSFYAPSNLSQASPYLQVDRTYNPRGLMTSLTNSLLANAALGTSAALLSSFSGMSYDAGGNRLAETASVPARGSAPDLSRSVTYQYDTLDQLTSETSSGSAAGTTYSNTFTYDLAGNPTTSSRLKGTGFNPDNQNTASVLANGQSVAITYNGTGDPLLLPYQTTTYPATYDPEDRLTVAVQGLLTAAYDGDGLRAWSSFNSTDPTYYLYDGDRPVVEEAYTGEDLFFSLFGATGLEGRNRDLAATGGDLRQISYSAYTYDPQGNLVQPVTLYPERSVGFMVRVDTSSAYDGFGWSRTVGAEGQIDPYSPVGFGGQFGYYRDYTGLYLLTHRYYDAGAGRFVTRDPIGYTGGINLYGFAGNNPVNESDPSGFDPNDDQSQQLSLGGRMRAFGNAPQFRPGSKERRDYSGFLSQLPGIGTAMAAHQAVTGHDIVGGTRLTAGQRMLAVGAAVLVALHIRGASAAGGIPKPNLSALPRLGMDLSEFGRFIGWGNRGDQAIARMQSLTDEDIQAMAEKGLTRKIAKQWADAYLQLHQHTLERTGTIDRFANPSSRSILMNHIAGRLPR